MAIRKAAQFRPGDAMVYVKRAKSVVFHNDDTVEIQWDTGDTIRVSLNSDLIIPDDTARVGDDTEVDTVKEVRVGRELTQAEQDELAAIEAARQSREV